MVGVTLTVGGSGDRSIELVVAVPPRARAARRDVRELAAV